MPFPESIDSLPDADVLDLSLSVSVDPLASVGQAGMVQATMRYATSARRRQADEFYQEQFERANAAAVQRTESMSGTRVDLEAIVASGAPGAVGCAALAHYQVSIDEDRGYRSVKVSASYEYFDYHATFERFAHWHNGDAPVPNTSKPTGIEISTFASGRQPKTTALYATHYRCAVTPHSTLRAQVDDRIREMGWGYNEPREGIMFMSDVAFDAETHVVDDDDGSVVTFVGEFQLR